MRELLPDLEGWLSTGEQVAIATVISTWGSAPRQAGAMMAVNTRGGMVGSVSGGCVEGAVIEAALKVIKTQQPERLHFGVSDDTAWGVGLACGGDIEIFVQPADKVILQPLIARLKSEQGCLLSTTIGGPGASLGAQVLTDEQGKLLAASPNAKPPAVTKLKQIQLQPKIITSGKTTEIFVNPMHASPTLVMIGGVHIAVALAKIARTLNFRTVIVDPRKVFSTAERFAHADELVQAWPLKAFEQVALTKATAVASLSHDPKIDDPALIAALASPAFYVGALGSKKTQARRKKRLTEAGVGAKNLARLHAPIGVEINAETPEEIALSVMAQVIAEYRR
jgi:xanthine dehydrogenase accessory factor